MTLRVAPAGSTFQVVAAAIRSGWLGSVFSGTVSSFGIIRVCCGGVSASQGLVRSHLCTFVGIGAAKIPVAPLVRTSGGGEFVAPDQPTGFGGLSKMVSCQVGLALVEIQHILWSHGQMPEQLVVQEVVLLPGPEIFEKGVLGHEFAKTVSAYKKSCSCATSEVKVLLEEVCCLNTIAGHIGMDLMLRRFPGIIEIRFWLTINSASTKEWESCGGQQASVSPCESNRSARHFCDALATWVIFGWPQNVAPTLPIPKANLFIAVTAKTQIKGCDAHLPSACIVASLNSPGCCDKGCKRPEVCPFQ